MSYRHVTFSDSIQKAVEKNRVARRDSNEQSYCRVVTSNCQVNVREEILSISIIKKALLLYY